MSAGRIQLLSIDAVRPSTYNPRDADPVRLQWIALSLRKLGFVLPLYADENGEILSGHQRHHVAGLLGFRQVPVMVVPAQPLAKRKNINVAFNRATNDLRRSDTEEQMADSLASVDLEAECAHLPDVGIEGDAAFPCLRTVAWKVEPLLERSKERIVPYATNMAKALAGQGITMPIVVTESGHVVNGIGRLHLAFQQGESTVQTTVIPDAAGPFAEAVLNRIAMNFALHERYADVLRYNSFSRARNARFGLGNGQIWAVFNGQAKHFDVIDNPDHRQKWLAEHGRTVLDFGAGHGTEADILRSIGVTVTDFEPYRFGDKADQIEPELGRQSARDFIEAVRTGQRWQTLFLSSVLNSVPFKRDRQHMVQILAACADEESTLYAAATSTASGNWKNLNGADYMSRTALVMVNFKANYESGVVVSDITRMPKMQKFHSPAEFGALFQPYFRSVWAGHRSGSKALAKCRFPRPINYGKLRAALEFEFDLPYPDGTRMGLVAEAMEAFSVRCGVNLNDYPSVDPE